MELCNILIQSRLTTGKRNMVSSIANLVYELPHELPSDLGLRVLGNGEILGGLKFGWRHSRAPSLPSRNEALAVAVKKRAKVENFSCPVQFYWISPFCSKYFARDCGSSSRVG